MTEDKINCINVSSKDATEWSLIENNKQTATSPESTVNNDNAIKIHKIEATLHDLDHRLLKVTISPDTNSLDSSQCSFVTLQDENNIEANNKPISNSQRKRRHLKKGSSDSRKKSKRKVNDLSTISNIKTTDKLKKTNGKYCADNAPHENIKYEGKETHTNKEGNTSRKEKRKTHSANNHSSKRREIRENSKEPYSRGKKSAADHPLLTVTNASCTAIDYASKAKSSFQSNRCKSFSEGNSPTPSVLPSPRPLKKARSPKPSSKTSLRTSSVLQEGSKILPTEHSMPNISLDYPIIKSKVKTTETSRKKQSNTFIQDHSKFNVRPKYKSSFKGKRSPHRNIYRGSERRLIKKKSISFDAILDEMDETPSIPNSRRLSCELPLASRRMSCSAHDDVLNTSLPYLLPDIGTIPIHRSRSPSLWKHSRSSTPQGQGRRRSSCSVALNKVIEEHNDAEKLACQSWIGLGVFFSCIFLFCWYLLLIYWKYMSVKRSNSYLDIPIQEFVLHITAEDFDYKSPVNS